MKNFCKQDLLDDLANLELFLRVSHKIVNTIWYHYCSDNPSVSDEFNACYKNTCDAYEAFKNFFDYVDNSIEE